MEDAGMSIFRFLAEFRFFFFTFRFFKNVFPLFLTSHRQKKKKKKEKKLACNTATIGRVQRASKARCLHSALEIWHRRKTVPRLPNQGGGLKDWGGGEGGGGWWDRGRGGWWSSGGMEEGLEVMVTEPACVLWPSNSSINCTPLPFPLPLTPKSFYTHTHSLSLSLSRSLSLSLSLCLSVSVSLSRARAHTHTHTHTHTNLSSLLKILSLSLSYRKFFTRQCLLCHQMMLKIAWPETHLTPTTLLSLSSPSCPALHYHTTSRQPSAGFLVIGVEQTHLSA